MVAKRVEVDERWKDKAECRGMETDVFFPYVNPDPDVPVPLATRADINHALMVCKTCPVTVECRAYANYFDIRQGIWGGVLLNRRGRPQTRLRVERNA